MARRDEHDGAPAADAPKRFEALSELLRELVGAPDAGAAAERLLRPGDVVGRYALVRELGRGGFGMVWEARDLELGRAVAVKMLHVRADAPIREQRLLEEADAAARLSHPNVVTLFDFGRSDLGPFLVLELLRGRTLQYRLALGPVPLPEALRIAAEIAEGVAHAHAHGVVHRDLKPVNVFLCDDGRVKVLDFGLAHALGHRVRDGGTPAYMAPEQWKGAPEDERTDVFAIGVILYRLISGGLPFPADDGGRALGSSRPARPLDVPAAPALGAFVARMLEKDPVKRPRDGAEVVAALRTLQREVDAVHSSPAGVVRNRRLRPAPLGLLLAVLALAVVAAVLATRRAGSVGASPHDGRVVVAVADFTNATSEPELDALTGLFVTSLEQSRRMVVLTRARMLDLARRARGERLERIDEVTAREVGRGAGARVILVPAVHRLGSSYTVELRAVDPMKDEYVFALKERAASKDELLGVLDRLSERTRAELREPATEVASARVEIGGAMTRSLEAFQHYARGLELRLQECDYVAAEDEERRALKLDPNFGAAHMQLGLLLLYVGDSVEDSSAHFRAAHLLAPSMPEKERRIIELDRFITPTVPLPGQRSDYEAEALRGYDELAARYPHDPYVLFMSGFAHGFFGRWERALELFQRSLDVDPGQCYVATFAQGAMFRLGRLDDAVAVARRAVESRPSASNRALLADALARTGKRDEAAERAREALAAMPAGHPMRARAACALATGGFPDEAYAAANELGSHGATERLRRAGRSLAASALALETRAADALRAWPGDEPWATPFVDAGACLLAAGRPRSGAPEAVARLHGAGQVVLLAGELAFRGDVEGARRAADRLEPGSTPAEAYHRAAALAGEQRWEDAVPALRALVLPFGVRAFGLPDPRTAYQLQVRLLLGEGLLAQGKPAEVVDALATADVFGVCTPESAESFPRILLLRARALEQLGRTSEAAAELRRLLRMWRRADPTLPLVREARAIAARLPDGAAAAR